MIWWSEKLFKINFPLLSLLLLIKKEDTYHIIFWFFGQESIHLTDERTVFAEKFVGIMRKKQTWRPKTRLFRQKEDHFRARFSKKSVKQTTLPTLLSCMAQTSPYEGLRGIRYIRMDKKIYNVWKYF